VRLVSADTHSHWGSEGNESRLKADDCQMIGRVQHFYYKCLCVGESSSIIPESVCVVLCVLE
jgi:hypothetical protein